MALTHQRHRDIEHRNVRARASFRLPVVRVAMEDRRYGESRNGIFEPAAAQERKDVAGFTLDRRLDRRVVEQGDEVIVAQPGQGGFELQRFVDRLTDEALDDLFAPRSERAASESTGESLDAREARRRRSPSYRHRA